MTSLLPLLPPASTMLVVDPPEHLRIMREEVFGPILPVIPYDGLQEAVAGINAGERPLGLWVDSLDMQVAKDALGQTTSGGACVSVCAVQGALPSLGFGGVGQSGSGRRLGIEGFREFSHPRGVVVRGTGDLADAFLPLTGPWHRASWTACSQDRVPPGRPRRAVPEPWIPLPWIPQRWIPWCGRRAA